MEIHAKSKFEVGDKVFTHEGKEIEISEISYNGESEEFEYSPKQDSCADERGWTICGFAYDETELGKTKAEALKKHTERRIKSEEYVLSEALKAVDHAKEAIKELQKELAEYK